MAVRRQSAEIYNCNDHHEPIAYTADTCPLCDAMLEIEDLKNEVKQLREEIQEQIQFGKD